MNVPQGEAIERPFSESFAAFLDWSSPAEIAALVPDAPSTIGPVVAVVAVVVVGAALYSRTLNRL